MMKRLVFVLLSAAIIAGGVAMYMKQDVGSMQVSFAEYQYQATLLEVGIGLLGILFAYLLLSYTFNLLKKVTSLFGEKRHQRLAERARHSLEQGLIELSEGRFAKAEKILLQKVEHNENALLTYLAAARAAQYQGAHDRRDDYLRQAHKSNPEADIAIGLTQAELQLEHQQFEQALATLNRLNELSPLHSYVLKLLAKAHHKLSDWDSLRELMPELHKTNAMSDEKLLSLQIDTWCGLISDRSRISDISAMTQLWGEVPRNIRELPEVVEYYASELVSVKASGEAEQVLRDYLNNNWQESTIVLYSELDILATETQLLNVEAWLEDQQHNAYLLLALGKMCARMSLWGKARSYLEASLSVQPMPVTFLKLAELLEDHMNEKALAQDYYRQGLHMLCGDYGEHMLANDFERVVQTPELKII
jgi:HemY protein